MKLQADDGERLRSVQASGVDWQRGAWDQPSGAIAEWRSGEATGEATAKGTQDAQQLAGLRRSFSGTLPSRSRTGVMDAAVVTHGGQPWQSRTRKRRYFERVVTLGSPIPGSTLIDVC
jgi:hypothetical protein